jgi:hypothetical protein
MLVNERWRNSSRCRRRAMRRVCAAPPWPRADSPATGRWVAALDTPGVGARERVAGRGLPEELREASLTSSRQCCNCVLHVFQMSQQDVASVLCECCKSRSRCFNVADVDPSTQHFLFPMLQFFSNVVNVATILNIFLMLQTLIFRCCGC